MARNNPKNKKIYAGYYLILSVLLHLLFVISEINDTPVLPAGNFSAFIFLNGGIAYFSLLIWMMINIIRNKKLKYKALWLVSFLIIYTGAPVFYFIFIYRQELTKINNKKNQ